MAKVIVIGGGVGGLTAAHELAERGFKVHVYESRAAWGGKARTQPVPGTGTTGRRDLPGEHGFRFYPRFYRHVIDTMARTPIAGASGGYVDDHLRPSTETAIALIDDDTWYRFHRRSTCPTLRHPRGGRAVLPGAWLRRRRCRPVRPQDPPVPDVVRRAPARRVRRHVVVGVPRRRRLLAEVPAPLRAVPRTMVAMDAQRGTARTVGAISMQLILDFANSGVATTARWAARPARCGSTRGWRTCRRSACSSTQGETCIGLDVAGGRIDGARFASGLIAKADHYVLAVPIDAAHGLMTPDLAALDPQCDRLRAANADQTRVVDGRHPVLPLRGRAARARPHGLPGLAVGADGDLAAAVLARPVGLFRRHYGSGDVGGLISVDVSDWDTQGTFMRKKAKECTPDEIQAEVWGQLKAALNGRGADEQTLTDDLLHSWHLDDDLDYSAACRR